MTNELGKYLQGNLVYCSEIVSIVCISLTAVPGTLGAVTYVILFTIDLVTVAFDLVFFFFFLQIRNKK